MNKKDTRNIKPIEELTIVDNFMFGAVLKNPKLAKRLLEIILDIKIEKSIDELYDAKSVRLDLYVQGEDVVYSVEMQIAKNKNLPYRSRFYQSIIDLNSLRKGQDYKQLKKSFIIFICTFDPFGQNRYVYTFQNRCNEDKNLLLEDDATKIFLNSKGAVGKINRELQSLLHYMDGHKPESDYTRDLQKAVEKIRQNKKWRAEYMTLDFALWERQKIGQFETMVSVMRNNHGKIENDMLQSILGVNDKTFNLISDYLTEHPDWDDFEIAEAIQYKLFF